MHKIEIKELTFAYSKAKNVLSNISLKVNADENVGIIGANGVGKSTLLKLMVGLLLDYEGALSMNGLLVKKENLTDIRKKVGYVFQDSDSQLFLSSVYEDVAFAPRNYGYSKEEVKAKVAYALRMIHMEEFQESPIYHLSGGQKKLVSIATVLSTEPDILLFDEPSAGLDPSNRRNLIHVIRQLPGTKVIASHDLDFIWDTCDRVILLSKELIIKDGGTKEVLTNQSLLEEHGLELPLSLSRGVSVLLP